MKRLLSLILAFFLVIPLAGCADNSNQVMFYYLRHPDTYQYGIPDGVIAPETRDISGYGNDLTYLLRLYMGGPSSEEFVSPFPAGTYLLSTQRKEQTLTLVFSAELSTLENMEQTLTFACLAYTCFDLVDVTELQIISGSESVVLTLDSFTLVDNAAAETIQ